MKRCSRLKKNRVKFRVTGEGEWKTGYIVETMPKNMFVVLGGDEVFTVAKTRGKHGGRECGEHEPIRGRTNGGCAELGLD